MTFTELKETVARIVRTDTKIDTIVDKVYPLDYGPNINRPAVRDLVIKELEPLFEKTTIELFRKLWDQYPRSAS